MYASSVSVVVPLLNEAELIQNKIQDFRALEALCHELIFVDGGSSDESLALLKKHRFTVRNSPRGRARQMNTGARYCSGEYLLFLHVDSDFIEAFKKEWNNISNTDWGFFSIVLSNAAFPYRVISQGINFRGKVFNVATGDQVIFVKNSVFQKLGGYKEIELMEDIEFTRRLRRLGRPKILDGPIVASARRWEKHGAIKTTLLMWWLQLAFKLGISPKKILSWYN